MCGYLKKSLFNAEFNADHFICLPEFVKITPYWDKSLVSHFTHKTYKLEIISYQAYISIRSDFDEFWQANKMISINFSIRKNGFWNSRFFFFFFGYGNPTLACYRPFPPLISWSTVAPRNMLDTSVIFHFEEKV